MENKTNKRNSDMRLSPEREVLLRRAGSLKDLEHEIEKSNVNITTLEMMNTLPIYINNLSAKQQIVFRSYYWKQMSLYDIKLMHGFRYLSDAERALESGTKKYIKYLLEDYGTKETVAS